MDSLGGHQAGSGAVEERSSVYIIQACPPIVLNKIPRPAGLRGGAFMGVAIGVLNDGNTGMEQIFISTWVFDAHSWFISA